MGRSQQSGRGEEEGLREVIEDPIDLATWFCLHSPLFVRKSQALLVFRFGIKEVFLTAFCTPRL